MEEKDHFIFAKYVKVAELQSDLKQLKMELKSPVIMPESDEFQAFQIDIAEIDIEIK